MNWLTAVFVWIETRLDSGAWFRRGYVVAATVLTWQTVVWSMRYADAALVAHASGADVAAVIGAVNLVVAGVQGFAFKHYLNSREAK